ncbi:MAG: hypothetical protein WAT54_08950 [Anaerostipes hadrus]
MRQKFYSRVGGIGLILNEVYLLDCCNTYKELSSKLNEIIVKATNHILKLAGTKVKDHWEIAFDRTKPKVITSPAGYFTGAAGMVVALLQIFCCRYIVWRKIKMKLLD